jgi:YVTN family beta-propeller protein
VQPNGEWVGVTTASDPISWIFRVDPTTLTTTDSMACDSLAVGMVLDPHRPYLYYSSPSFGTVELMRTDKWSYYGWLTLGGRPHNLAYSSPAGVLYAANATHGVDVVDIGVHRLEPPLDSMPLGPGAFGLGLTPDHMRLYVTMPDEGKVHVLDVPTGTLIYTLPVGGTPRDVAVSALGMHVVITNVDGWVDVITLSGA